MNSKKLSETINSEQDLLAKLSPLPETQIFDFMQNLRGGTYFNMGMYSFIPVSRAYKKTLRIYKVLNMTAIVSGVSYENIGTTKDFRDRTGKGPGAAWYDHMPGFENKIGIKKSDPNSKYVLWDIKAGSDNWVRYYLVDIATGVVTPVSKAEIENSDFLTATEKAKLTPKKVEGYDKTTGELIENQTNWRTAAFEHIFWLSQAGKGTKEYGTKFMESKQAMNKNTLEETTSVELFRDAHADVRTNLDAILSGSLDEEYQNTLTEEADEAYEPATYEMIAARALHYMRVNNDMEYQDIADELGIDVQDVLNLIGPDSYDDEESLDEAVENTDTAENDINESSQTEQEAPGLTESYRRIVSRGKTLNENELFVDFD